MNKKQAMMEFINMIVCIPMAQRSRFLTAQGYTVHTTEAARVFANVVGSREALARLKAFRKGEADTLAVARSAMLAEARAAWINGDARAFDKINW